MSAAAAGALLMWMGGVLMGMGVATDYRLAAVGSILSMAAMFYVRRFAESD